VALNPTYSERELEQALDSMRVSVAIATDAVLRTPRPRAGTHGSAAGHRHVDQGVPVSVLRVLFTWFKEKKDGHRHRVAGGHWWLQDLLRSTVTAPPQRRPLT
jgi:hypothetical protein